MIMGSTWKAKTGPASWPGSTGPKRNCMPALEESMAACTPFVMTCRARLPRSQ